VAGREIQVDEQQKTAAPCTEKASDGPEAPRKNSLAENCMSSSAANQSAPSTSESIPTQVRKYRRFEICWKGKVQHYKFSPSPPMQESTMGHSGAERRRWTFQYSPLTVLLGRRAINLTKIHGRNPYPLKKGYAVMILPKTARFEPGRRGECTPDRRSFLRKAYNWLLSPFRRRSTSEISLSSNYSMIRVLVSIAQLLFGVYVLVRARGNQVQRYGYAAPGLSVSPYVGMSLLNLLGNLVCPVYPCLYQAHSKWTDEAIDRDQGETAPGEEETAQAATGGDESPSSFAFVGRITEETEKALEAEIQKYSPHLHSVPQPSRWYSKFHLDRIPKYWKWRAWVLFALGLAFSFAPASILVTLSNPSPEVFVTTTSRKWTVWIATQVTAGAFLGSITELLESRPILGQRLWNEATRLTIATLYSVPSIILMVQVAKLILEYGICERISRVE